MNEKDLNIEYICEKTLLDRDDELVPIILDLIQNSYKAGLCQAEFDNTMNLIEENEELKKINEEHKKLNGDLRKENQEIRLDQTKKVFHVLTHVLLNGGCTYRYLIYDLLDFKPENYSDLIEGMNIVNAIATLEELKEQVEVGEQQYNDLVEEKEKLDAENQVLKDYKNVALTYMKNYLKMELNYRNKDIAEHFKVVIDMLNRGNKHGNLVDITDCGTQQKEFIKWLEDYLKLFDTMDIEEQASYDTIEEILQKYREIIGDINDKK